MIKKINAKNFQKQILAWFEKAGRKNLPWQLNITPYRVWVSEIMLQQTQVNTVIEYFERFIQRFPIIEDLAKAPLDEVLHLWTGLGYYARARNLHTCAKLLAEKFQGIFPTDLETLQTLPGIGRSTAGAILALSMKIPAPILDGNVKRVLTRYHAIPVWPGEPKTQKLLWEIAEEYTPKQHVEKYTQAIMDLGAMICTRVTPQCKKCPLEKSCDAHAKHQEEIFPIKNKTKKLPVRKIKILLIINDQQEILLQKRPPTGIWGGLWSCPEYKEKVGVNTYCQQHWHIQVSSSTVLPSFRHTFSHFHLDITPILIKLTPQQLSLPHYVEEKTILWYNRNFPQAIGLPQPIKKLLMQGNIDE